MGAQTGAGRDTFFKFVCVPKGTSAVKRGLLVVYPLH